MCHSVLRIEVNTLEVLSFFIKAVDEELYRIIKCLYKLFNDTDAKTSTKAKCLLTSTLDFEFVIGLAILKIILPNTAKLISYVLGSTIYN